ncbi:MAG: site-specific DNA-methyltransferase [archaeon]|nr:site-specific DNA-methyltransferase [archaeon]
MDALDLLKQIPDKSIDLVLTDPPYIFKKGGFGGGQGEISKRALKSDIVGGGLNVGFNIKEYFKEFKRVLKKINILIFCSEDQMLDICNYARENNYYYTVLVWNKTNPTPLCNNRYLNSTEFFVHIREKGVKILGNYHSKHKVYTSSVNKKDKDKYKHPTIKPQELIKNILFNHSIENDLILDCFMGSWTTAITCKENKRNFIGCELDKDYCEIGKQRLRQMTLL